MAMDHTVLFFDLNSCIYKASPTSRPNLVQVIEGVQMHLRLELGLCLERPSMFDVRVGRIGGAWYHIVNPRRLRTIFEALKDENSPHFIGIRMNGNDHGDAVACLNMKHTTDLEILFNQIRIIVPEAKLRKSFQEENDLRQTDAGRMPVSQQKVREESSNDKSGSSHLGTPLAQLQSGEENHNYTNETSPLSRVGSSQDNREAEVRICDEVSKSEKTELPQQNNAEPAAPYGTVNRPPVRIQTIEDPVHQRSVRRAPRGRPQVEFSQQQHMPESQGDGANGLTGNDEVEGAQIAKLDRENRAPTESNRHLKDQNYALMDEKRTLTARIHSLTDENHNLADQNRRVTGENVVLQDENRILRDRNRALEDRNRDSATDFRETYRSVVENSKLRANSVQNEEQTRPREVKTASGEITGSNSAHSPVNPVHEAFAQHSGQNRYRM